MNVNERCERSQLAFILEVENFQQSMNSIQKLILIINFSLV